ncbi:amylo-alpha-1,6-glucosidase [Psychromicrobium xiongbiense]|uniref:amylo-alpha-1,6-glucosidase n=1 Tax=Psychromicrobium xiongbiense TaxID=3051184 RepID=UPI002553FFE5|nr:glycogen debranching N-terminal domain-containing protein [Psychromicrobium sp. YIM S02556]
MPSPLPPGSAPRQPFLNDATMLVAAPVQLWSAADGEAGTHAIDGLYVSEHRVVSRVRLRVNEELPSYLATAQLSAGSDVLSSVPRSLDDAEADPRVLLERHREVTGAGYAEQLRFLSGLDQEREAVVQLRLGVCCDEMQRIKAGLVADQKSVGDATTGESVWEQVTVDPGAASFRQGLRGNASEGVCLRLSAPGAEVSWIRDELIIQWRITIPARGETTLSWQLDCHDAAAVVSAASGHSEWSSARLSSPDSRLTRWAAQALSDLDGLRLQAHAAPGHTFLAAGAPWFFTLFGRDSIWAARMLLPLGTGLAASTLKALAAFQGTVVDPERAEEPGKIPHELRPAAIHLPGEGVFLPPLYYGTVDATMLWIALLHDAWTWGLPEQDIRELLPALRSALGWLRDYADPDGDGFIEYHDASGHGLSNQGWKDSGDSIQFQDGTLAQGPLALCEVQGYAYEAARDGAVLLRRFGDAADRAAADAWEDWAAALKFRFGQRFWIAGGPASGGRPYPAVALDVAKRQVDSLASNFAHLLGTGILAAGQAELLAELLNDPLMDSGVGMRTLATSAAGYWPLSYHGGAVWTHDTAIALWGLHREGLGARAGSLIEGLLRVAEGFHYRVPELHSGEPLGGRPVPYPAACRPQAWSAAAVIAVAQTMLGLQPGKLTEPGQDPDARQGEPRLHPIPGMPGLMLEGVRQGRDRYLVSSESGHPVRQIDPAQAERLR